MTLYLFAVLIVAGFALGIGFGLLVLVFNIVSDAIIAIKKRRIK